MDAIADNVYDNGPPYRPSPPDQADGYEMTGWIEADDFTFAAPNRIESITFSDLEAGTNNFQGSILWRIYSNASNDTPGTLLYSGLSTNVTHAATGFFAAPAFEFLNTVVITPVDLPAGTYWLVMHNGPLSNNTNHFVYWEKAAGAGARPSYRDPGPLFPGAWHSNSTSDSSTSELIFQLTGVPAPRATVVTRLNGRPQITFTASANRYYRIEYRDTLIGSWSPLPTYESVYSPDGSDIHATDPDPNVVNLPHRFYRSVLL